MYGDGMIILCCVFVRICPVFVYNVSIFPVFGGRSLSDRSLYWAGVTVISRGTQYITAGQDTYWEAQHTAGYCQD